MKTRGLVVGKFYPPHLGHSYLINTALKKTDIVDVLVVDNPRYGIPASKRLQWLKNIHPTANFHIIQDINDDDNSENWAKHTIKLLGYAPNFVFSSEEYGDAYARYMGARHIMVDKQRLTIPVSGTKVRNDTISMSKHLSDVVRGALTIRVVVIGAESTGTTTLAKALATHYKAPYVPEIGRYYTESLLSTNHSWNDTDFKNIARIQQDYEATIARRSGGIIFCDTNATATTLWQKRYLGHISNEVADIASHDRIDLYIITGDEIPFEQDGTRDGEHIRRQMHKWFIELAQASDTPSITVVGNKKERLLTATSFIDRCLVKLKVVKDRQTTS